MLNKIERDVAEYYTIPDLKILFLIIRDLFQFYRFSLRLLKRCNLLDSYITKSQILNPNHYGFRKNHSTHLVIIDMCNNITKSLDDGKAVI